MVNNNKLKKGRKRREKKRRRKANINLSDFVEMSCIWDSK